MLQTSDEYKVAINAPTRRIVPKAVIDLTDPDLVVTTVSGDYDAGLSFPSQLYDRDETFSGQMYATLETNRWLLDGSQAIMPDDPTTRAGEQGVIGEYLSDADGVDGGTLSIAISGVDTLQVVTVAGTGQVADGFPYQLTLNIYSSGLLLHTQTEQPTGSTFVFDGFTVIQPTDIELVVDEWNLPDRRFRFVEFLPGVVETWGGETIFSVNVIQKADFSNLTIPYSSASLAIDNTDKRFDPADKSSIFLSVTARQPVPLWLGVEIEDTFEYVPVGVFYQQNEGWHIENDGLVITWDLIDIVGLLVDRKYDPPNTLPTTLGDWIDSIVGQLGSTFSGHYTIDGALASTALTCNASDVADITCGNLLRFICQASNSFPISDPETGYLHIKELSGVPQDEIMLRAQNSRPGSRSNTDIAFLSFDVNGTVYNVPGTEEISDKTVTIKNPFITTTMDAVYAAQLILTQYGGNVIEAMCRGDMSREIGDVETVEVYPNETVGARVFEQQLKLENGIMTNVPLKMLQANGGELYTDYIYITESGTYTMPAGVTQITLVLIGGGDGGNGGDAGTAYYFDPDKDGGIAGGGGRGGKVYSTPLVINDGQQIDVVIGAGGAGGSGGFANYPYRPNPQNKGQAGAAGQPTTATLGTTFTSANGVYMSTGYVDLLTNKVYAVPGVAGTSGRSSPQRGERGRPHYGNGGSGGDGGAGGVHWSVSEIIDIDPLEDFTLLVEAPKNGAGGGAGGSGCVIIFYSR